MLSRKKQMSKILLTGMSAPQASPSANSRTLSFAGLLHKSLTEAGHDVVWGDPDLNQTKAALSKFDSVVVGVSPLTSLAANRVYGALSIIDHLWGSPKLSLFIDAPQVSQIEFSINSIKTNPETFAKDFFSYRKGYQQVASDEKLKSRLLKCVTKLSESEWPTVMYPALPWSQDGSVKKLLPSGVTDLVGINLDSYLIQDRFIFEDRRRKWCVDNYKNAWVDSTLKTLTFPHSPLKWNKGWTDTQVIDQIDRSIGVLIAPQKREGSWWTTRVAQALGSYTPVITDWKQSASLGPEWDILAATFESMSDDKRLLVATAQRESYISRIPTKLTAMKLLESTIRVTNSQEESNE
jgi:hypothetical protein